MQIIYSFILIFSLLNTAIFAQEQIGVAAAVNRNTTDLTLEQERKLVEAGYQIIQNHTIETDEIGKAQIESIKIIDDKTFWLTSEDEGFTKSPRLFKIIF